MTARVLLQSDWFNAFYAEGELVNDGPPEHLDIETLARTFPDAEIYHVPDDVYDDELNGAGYPLELSAFPLHRCQKIR